MRARHFGLGVLLVAQASVIVGCASPRMRDAQADRLFRDAKYAEAADYLRTRMKGSGPGSPGANDELLYLLDAGLSLHQAGKFEESNAFFVLAEKHVGLNDFTSLSEQAGTLVTSENTKVYRGEDFEKVLIHVYKAMNYSLLGNFEGALVEARLVNRRLEQLKREGEKPYKQNGFARYLSAILYEAEGELNDAYLDYKKTYELEPSFRSVGIDLWRVAAALGFREDLPRWKKAFDLTESEMSRESNRVLTRRTGLGEIIVIYQNGISPMKTPDPDFPSLPRFVARSNPVREAEVEIDGEIKGRTLQLYDIEATAISNLDEKKLAMAAKRIAGRVVKAAVAEGVRRASKNEALGLFAELFLVISDQADTRSWNLLPRDLQIFRFSAEPGEHLVRIRPVGGPELEEKTVKVEAGKKSFLSFRFIP
ncbi:MAG: hypothetical protein KGQ59_05435 [Bdellovibrionales bacterium]|nr:hypothetical protein [Bdellovibrionales bacterium]